MSGSGSGRAGLTRRGVMGLAAAGLALGGLPAEAASPRRKKATQVAERVVPLAERDDLIGHIEYYVTDGQTTLLEVAHHYDIGVPHISALNPGVDAWVPGSGRTLTLPTAHILPDAPHEGLVINRPELRLYYFPGNGPVQTYSIGVGKDGLNTPVGKTWVVRKQVHPTWHPTEASFREKPWLPKAVPPGPDNPMGDYAMYLGWPAYAIHGTNRVYGVGRRVSHGCIRLYPEGIEKLFREVPVGTKVTVVDQSVKVGWHKGELYMEVLPSLEQIDDLEVNYVITHQLPAPDPRPLIEAKAGREAQRVNWDLVEIERLIRRGIPVKITGTPDEERPEEPQVAEAVRGVEATPLATAEAQSPVELGFGSVY